MPDLNGARFHAPRGRDPAVGGDSAVASTGGGDADRTELARVCDWEEADGLTISNKALTVTADPAQGGSVTAVIDRRTGRNLLGGPGNDLVLQEEYEQHPRWVRARGTCRRRAPASARRRSGRR